MLLDIIEVACSHSGFNLATAFASILKEFGISDKASNFRKKRVCLTHQTCQILSITCDNASNNDKMFEVLEVLMDDFPGAANQTRCFLHILNLVVKSIIQQFDLPKSKKRSGSDNNDVGNDGWDNDEATEALLRLAGDIDVEGDLMAEGDEEDDNIDGWIDEHGEMTEDELKELSVSVAPVRLLLTKV
jgi:hypothetical protein